MTFDELLAARQWKPIPRCAGRYLLAEPEPALTPAQLAQTAGAAAEFRVERAKDPVFVLLIEGGGLISYRRSDGTFLHTLNNQSGLSRKLAQLGIDLTQVVQCRLPPAERG